MKVSRVHIKNFKSIVDLSLDLGPVNVFIGENGSGKSNILEALAFAAAAASDKLDNEFLASRGIRVTDPRFMRSAFAETSEGAVSILVEDSRGGRAIFEINTSRNTSYPKWSAERTMSAPPGLPPLPSRDQTAKLLSDVSSAEILPLGIRGEGLLKLLRVLASEDQEGWAALQSNLGLLDWFSGIEVDHDSSLPEQSIRLRDRFMAAAQPAFDQRSANEGFLYLLFFFALIVSKATPRFFAIENVDTSLNPKACSELMRRLAALAVEHDKQILFTTHNPSLLDELNLHDDRQRLFVVFRNKDGHTAARRVMPPKPIGNELPMKLSEAFTRGLLGGIPQNF